jgi:ribosomal-protein-serine acetyltransferase
MTAACRAVVRHAFAEMHLQRVVIRCAVENRRSRAIPERLGFKLEGVEREAEWLYDHFVDLAVYSLLERERSNIEIPSSVQAGRH